MEIHKQYLDYEVDPNIKVIIFKHFNPSMASPVSDYICGGAEA